MSKPMIAHIVAASENHVIGNDGELPWSIPEDMKWFRERTKNRALIMGRKTFASVGHPLPHRLNVVITRQKDYAQTLPEFPAHSPVIVVDSLESALKVCNEVVEKYHNEIFIIGGGEIYKQSLHLVDTVFLTRVYKHIDGDTTYPILPEDEFRVAEEKHYEGEPPFTIFTYKRR